MYLYLIIAVALVLHKEVFKLVMHLVPLIISAVIFVVSLFIKQGGKQVYKGGKKAIGQMQEFDRYMMAQRWRR